MGLRIWHKFMIFGSWNISKEIQGLGGGDLVFLVGLDKHVMKGGRESNGPLRLNRASRLQKASPSPPHGSFAGF